MQRFRSPFAKNRRLESGCSFLSLEGFRLTAHTSDPVLRVNPRPYLDHFLT